MNLKLGKKPATYDHRDALFATFRTSAPLPAHPKTFGHEGLIKSWGMLANDQVGDCVIASGMHQTMLWCAETGAVPTFTDALALQEYSAITGYNPANPDSDQGTNVRDALSYRQKTGLLDAAGVRHKIGGYLALEPGNIEHIKEALWLFGIVELGINFPDTAMDQFDRRHTWSVVSGARVEGGHDIPLVANRKVLECVTWNAIQGMTQAFFKKYCDEAYAIISPEMLKDGKTLEGFDLPALQAYLVEVSR